MVVLSAVANETSAFRESSELDMTLLRNSISLVTALIVLAGCSSDDAPSDARQLACKIAYQEELDQADKKFMQDSADFQNQANKEEIPTRLSIRVQESFNNNRDYIKARASRKLETCLTTGYYEQPTR